MKESERANHPIPKATEYFLTICNDAANWEPPPSYEGIRKQKWIQLNSFYGKTMREQ